MKSKRHQKILELIGSNAVDTQEELLRLLRENGYEVTQATVSRDIRELKLMKIARPDGGSRYTVMGQRDSQNSEKYIRVLKDAFLSMEMAQNILVIKTVSGMAMAVAAALDAMDCHEIVGSIAGDDTIMCAVRTVEDTTALMGRLRRIMED